MNKERTEKVLAAVQKTKRMILLPYAYSFRWCNNHCEFCYLKPARNDKLMSLDEFKDLGNTQITWLNKNVNKLPEGTVIECHIIGGEIGALPDEYFNCIYDLLKDINRIICDKKIHLKTIILTNLILTKEKMKNIMSLYNYAKSISKSVLITTSFDMTGRFENEIVSKIWKNNVDMLIKNGYVVYVETLLRKSAIEKYLNNDNDKLVLLFNDLLDMDLNNKLMVILNEYQPYDSKSINEVPDFDKVCEFYKKVKKLHGTNINLFKSYKLDEKYCSNFFCEYITIVSILEKDNVLKGKDGIQENSPCELLTHTFWPKDDKIKVEDISKNKISSDYICFEHPEKVNYFFNNIYGCGICKYYKQCIERNLRDCYQNQQFIWKNNKCIHKKLFEMVNNV